MVEFFLVLGIAMLLWLMWQLHIARKLNQFKQYIDNELRPQVLALIKQELVDGRCEGYPNNHCHIEATLLYWGQYRIRVLQAALEREVITTQWLKDTGNYRNSQHLFHTQQVYLTKNVERINLDD